MKSYSNNPRSMKEKKFQALKKDLELLGDLGGIVHDLNTDSLVGGNHRMRAMFGEKSGDEFSIKDADIEIVTTYKKPTKSGTVATGFVLWKGEKYAYRQVRFNEKKFKQANIVANIQKADWDWDVLANNFGDKELLAWGFDQEFVDTQISNLVGSREIMAAVEAVQLTGSEEEESEEGVSVGGDDLKFKEVGKENVTVEHACPKCGYTWSGKARQASRKKKEKVEA